MEVCLEIDFSVQILGLDSLLFNGDSKLKERLMIKSWGKKLHENQCLLCEQDSLTMGFLIKYLWLKAFIKVLCYHEIIVLIDIQDTEF